MRSIFKYLPLSDFPYVMLELYSEFRTVICIGNYDEMARLVV